MTEFAILRDSDCPLSILQALGPEWLDSPQAVRADEGGAEAVGGAGRQCKVHRKHLRPLFTIKNEFGAAGPPEMYDRFGQSHAVQHFQTSLATACEDCACNLDSDADFSAGRGWLRARGCCIT